jgi:hypothetical protein
MQQKNDDGGLNFEQKRTSWTPSPLQLHSCDKPSAAPTLKCAFSRSAHTCVFSLNPLPFHAEKTHTHASISSSAAWNNNYSSSGHFNDDLGAEKRAHAAYIYICNLQTHTHIYTYNLFCSHFITKDKRLLPVLTHSAVQPLTRAFVFSYARANKRPVLMLNAFSADAMQREHKRLHIILCIFARA